MTMNTLERPPWLTETAWPWPIRSIETPAGRVAVTDAGAGGVVLFVHTGAWSFIWRDVIRRLAPEFRCITIDAPGCGLSDRLHAPATLQSSADAVISVIDELGLEDVVLAAHDLGGPAGLAAAAARPDKIKAIAAINCFAWQPDAAVLRGMLSVMGSAPMRAIDVASGWLPAATSTRFGVGRHWDASDREIFRRGVDAGARRAWHDYFASAMRSEELFAGIAEAIDGPIRDKPLITIFGDRNDPMKFQPRWRSLYPAARQEVVEGGLHFPMCDDPERVARILVDWMGDL